MSSTMKENSKGSPVIKKLAIPNRIQKYNESVRSKMNGSGGDMISSKDFDFKSGDTFDKNLDNSLK